MPEIEDIIETTETAPLFLWWQWAWIAVGLILLLIGLKMLLKSKVKPPTPVNNLKSALERLSEIEQKELNDVELATEASLLTRQYLQHQFNNPSLFQTHQEFINQLNSSDEKNDLERIPEAARNEITHYLKVLGEHKYSPSSDLPAEKEKLIRHTETLLRGVDSSIPRTIS